MIKKNIVILFTLFTLSASSQEIPLFSQYIFNGLLLNPAYAGSRDVLSVSLMNRDQWSGFSGAPYYQSLSAHTPTRNPKIGVGFLFLNENTGKYSNTQAHFNYSYQIKTERGAFSIGFKAGIVYANFNYKNLFTNDYDIAFNNSADNYLLPNFGVGAYYFSNKYFIGFSIPYLLSYKQNSTKDGFEINQSIDQYQFLLTSGFLWQITDGFKLKPSTLVKYNRTYGIESDLNINAIILNDKLWLGAGYRLSEAIVSMVEYQLNPQFRFGYSYDYSMSNNSILRFSSHEFSLRYEFSYRLKAANPRYF